MAVEIVIPKLGMTMTEGTLAEWLVPDGGRVGADEPLFHLTTDKLDHDEMAPSAGILRRVVEAGETLECGTLIGYLLSTEEVGPSVAAAPSAPSAVVRAPTLAVPVAPNEGAPAVAAARDRRIIASPLARAAARERKIDLATVTGSGPGGRIILVDVQAAEAAGPGSGVVVAEAAGEARLIASPLARRVADEHRVDLASVTGTGPGGRITKDDVLAAATAVAASAPAAVQALASITAAAEEATQRDTPERVAPARSATEGPVTAPAAAAMAPARGPASSAASVPSDGASFAVTGMRKVIAERMHASLQQMAQLTITTEAVVDDLAALRAQLIAEWADDGVKPSYTDLVMKAAAKALRRHRGLNAEFRTDEQGASTIVFVPAIHVGMAVALGSDEGGSGPLGGLIVPTTRDTDTLSVYDLAQTTSDLAGRARSGKLTFDEMTGATFTVTTLGSQGVDAFTPVINPPNVAILGVGRIKGSVGWDGDRPVKRQVITLSLSFDHRAVDGAPAAEFLKSVRELLEAPFRLLV